MQTLPATGTYTFEVSRLRRRPRRLHVQGPAGARRARTTTTDLNALFFDRGRQLPVRRSATSTSSVGKPFEIAGFHGRGGAAAGDRQGQHGRRARRRSCATSSTTACEATEYVQPLAPSIYGHPLADGATAVAAVRPVPAVRCRRTTRRSAATCRSYFDSAGNRLPQPDIRRAPQVAATDGGNTTFFTPDSKLDPDTQPNFFGTSAAAPHAAGDRGAGAAGARRAGSLSPDAMRALLRAQHVQPRPRRLPRARRRAAG